MSECVGDGCAHPGCNRTQQRTAEEARRELANLLSVNPDKFATLPRRERRAAEREERRRR